jgi:hypothetical protein
LIELARKPNDDIEWSAERRELFYQRVVEKAEKERQQRRVRRAFVAGASTMLVIGALLKLIVAVATPATRSSPELAGGTPAQQLATE